MWVASGSEDSTIILWCTIDGTIEREWVAHGYNPIRFLAFSPDSRYLASGGDKTIAIWDLSKSARRVATLDGHKEAVTSCAWSSDGALIASASRDGTSRLWNAHTFEPLSRLHCGHTPHRDIALAFSPDGRWLVAGAALGLCMNYGIWNLRSSSGVRLHRVVLTEPPDSPTPSMSTMVDSPAFAFGPGTVPRLTLAVSGRTGVEIWDVEEGKRRFSFGRDAQMNGIYFSPDGRLVLTVPADGTMKIWAADTGDELFQLNGHTDGVRAACFSPCGEYIASASLDQTVRLWRTWDASCLATLSEHRAAVTHVAFSLNGKTLSSGADNGSVVIRYMHDIIPSDDEEDS